MPAKTNAYVNIQKIQNILSNGKYITLKRIYDGELLDITVHEVN